MVTRSRLVERNVRIGAQDRRLPFPVDAIVASYLSCICQLIENFRTTCLRLHLKRAQVIDLAEREGFEPDSDPLSDQEVTDSENNSVPGDPQKTP